MLPSSSRWVCRQQRCRNSNQVDPCVDPGCKMPVAGCGSWMLLIGCVSIFSSCRLGLFWLDGLFDSDWLFWFCLRMHPYILPSEDRGSESKIWEFVNPFRCLSPELFWMYLVENHVIFPNNVSNWQLTYHFLNFCYPLLKLPQPHKRSFVTVSVNLCFDVLDVAFEFATQPIEKI